MSTVRLYNADCLEVLATLEPGRIAIVTDPPYGIKYNPSGGDNAAKRSNFVGVRGDDRPFDPTPFLRFNRVILWGANHYADRLPVSSCWLVWDKRDGGNSNDMADCEMAWSGVDAPARLFSHRWMGMIRDSERNKVRVHPTQKPVALMLWCFQELKLQPGDTVFDPYMGSGTTGVACLRAGMNFIGCEIDAQHHATAERRIEAERTRHPLFAGCE